MITTILLGNLLITCFMSLYALIGSIATGNYSIIDRSWSIFPVGIVLYMTQEWSNILKVADPFQMWLKYPKLGFMMLLPLLWGCRLTYNFARKGGYSLTGDNEDYRWGWLRQNTILRHRLLFEIFNLTFISTYQTIILLLIVHPMYLVIHVLSIDPNHIIGQFTIIDMILTITFLTLLYIEWTTDNEQWEYYSFREQYRQEKWTSRTIPDYCPHDLNELKQGFHSTGLFSISRHLNFFCEISLWFIYATFAIRYLCLPSIINNQQLYPTMKQFWTELLYSLHAIEILYHPYTVYLGALLLLGIFLGSTPFTEYISSTKYPEYKEYQTQVPRLIPNPIRLIQFFYNKWSIQTNDE